MIHTMLPVQYLYDAARHLAEPEKRLALAVLQTVMYDCRTVEEPDVDGPARVRDTQAYGRAMTQIDRERALVDQLVADARPVRRLWSPEVRLALWLAVAAAGLAALAARIARDDLPLQLRSPSFLVEQLLLLLGGSVLGLEAFRAAVPGRALRSATLVAGWTAVALGLGWMLRAPVHTAWV